MSKLDFDIRLTDDYLVDTDGTSDGTQMKYFSEGYWYKTNNEGEEDIVEYLVSKLLSFTDMPKEEYVIYERGLVNGKRACRSKTFITPDETFVTLDRMHVNITGQRLHEAIRFMKGIEESAKYVLDFFKNVINLDLFEYFKRVFTVDYISLNEDRHFHNLGVIMSLDGQYRPAPIFDNGKSLLNTNPSISYRLSISENVKRVTARPFSGSHKRMFEYFGKGFSLDKESAITWLETEENSFYKDVLMYQLQNLELD